MEVQVNSYKVQVFTLPQGQSIFWTKELINVDNPLWQLSVLWVIFSVDFRSQQPNKEKRRGLSSNLSQCENTSKFLLKYLDDILPYLFCKVTMHCRCIIFINTHYPLRRYSGMTFHQRLRGKTATANKMKCFTQYCLLVVLITF